MIDLGNAKLGDILIHRNGGRSIIKNKSDWECAYFLGGIQYFYTGNVLKEEESPFDVVSIEKPPFDWETVKSGMAFRYTNSNALGLVRFVGWNKNTNGIVVTNEEAPDKHLREIAGYEILIRAPEQDIL